MQQPVILIWPPAKKPANELEIEMTMIEYEKLETRRVDAVPQGSKVKLPDDTTGRVFVVGHVDQHGMISLLRGKLGKERIEVSATPSHPVVIHEEAAE